ncbi:MAG: DUF4399 domain-containing protein [Deltaproteobacteria bacterium]|nr:DUF4399 domain-containing protein [Deltaproteobacteria bacterium]
MTKHIKFFCYIFLSVILVCSTNLYATEPPGVGFLNLKNGETVISPVKVEMTIVGMKVGPAGVPENGVGHHHIIIDGTFVEAGKVIPADDHHIHFGKGQTEALVTLTPGKHTLTLQFADGIHRSYGQNWSSTITLNVQPAGK